MSDWTRTYTIDIIGDQTGWRWRLYSVGGRNLIDSAEADTLEAASSDARTRMIVAHREDTP